MRPRSTVARSETSVRQSVPSAQQTSTRLEFSAGAQALVEAYRVHGYHRASINPLETDFVDSSPMAALDPRTYGLVPDESIRYLIHLGGVAHTLTLSALSSYLKAAYCGSISVEAAHLRSIEQRQWLYTRMEARGDSAQQDDPKSLQTLARLVGAEAFEHYHRANLSSYKQYSLEGSESLVVALRAIVEWGVHVGLEDIVLALPHRGRLNMMLNALDIPAKELMGLFSRTPEPSLAASDLKDHAGFSRRIETLDGGIRVLLAHNPSHLESVSPVVCGIARALQDRRKDGFPSRVMAVLVHGDASFSGQGIVAETFNLSHTRGYDVGGALHLILNNQIGSSVSHPNDSRSTLYCADIARAIDAPILRVNADDPDGVVFVSKLATDFRVKFGADIVIDHVGYRRYGHFVGQDPAFTRPAMQRRIHSQRSVTKIYADRLVRRELADSNESERLRVVALAAMARAQAECKATDSPPVAAKAIPPRRQTRVPVRTAVPLNELRSIITRLAAPPPGLELHVDIATMLGNWRWVASEIDRPVDWCLAENLAYGSLLANGFNIRLTGLDVGRGTFNHRQHVWHDQAADTDWQNVHIPLRQIADRQGIFSIFESPLSEEAVLGYEYGYSLQCGRDLVLWEAQFGDFVNNAQVIIDQFIASGEAKWGYRSGLVLLLPHGHDGSGPEHSCAYLGRFLQLCADGNMQVAVPSTAAQMYHLLRRQGLEDVRTPLIVMTPKQRLYDLASSHSRLNDLADGQFHPLLLESAAIDRTGVVRAIITSGKLYYDLVAARSAAGLYAVWILRVEQLYPFPTNALGEELARLPGLRQVVWAQEEAKNHGAWHLVRDQLAAAIPPGVTLTYAGRSATAPTAVANPIRHSEELVQLVAEALGVPNRD